MIVKMFDSLNGVYKEITDVKSATVNNNGWIFKTDRNTFYTVPSDEMESHSVYIEESNQKGCIETRN